MPTTRAMLERTDRPDSGMATAEFAVGTVAATCIGCVLVYLGQDDHSFFFGFVTSILDSITSILPFTDGFPGPHRPWLM